MLQGLPGDTGAYIKNAIGSVVLFGAPPEKYWKYNGLSESLNPDFNIEPTAFCYAFGQNYQAIKYVRLDHPDVTSKDVIKKMKEHIVKGLPNIFGFTCFETLRHPTTSSGKIPFPDTNERDIGGHAVVTAGYDDAIEVTNPISKESTKGAFLIRNSWGEEWGESGYGWLPYKLL